MTFDFYPWILDIDVEATKQLYAQNDFAKDKAVNERFVSALSAENLYADFRFPDVRQNCGAAGILPGDIQR